MQRSSLQEGMQSFASGGSSRDLHANLVLLLRQGFDKGTLVSKDGFNSIPSDAWLNFGAAWVSGAVHDVVSSVAARSCCRLSAGERPATPGKYPVTPGARPMSPVKRPVTPGKRPVTPSQHPTTLLRNAGEQASRFQLLTLKHFVAAVKEDQGLHACHVLGCCLVEVATGEVPHVEVELLMKIPSYCARLLCWVEHESDGSREGMERAAARAMKSAAKTTRKQVGIAVLPNTASKVKSRQPVEPKTRQRPISWARHGRGWLPEDFVREFNGEGDEVESSRSDFDRECMVADETL